MATLLDRRPATNEDMRPSSLTPVKWWAGGGVVILGLIAYSVARWLLGGHAHSTPTGPTAVEPYMTVIARVMEATFVLACIPTVYWMVIKPWRRDGRISANGLMCLSFWTVWWFTDPMGNYLRVTYTYSSVSFNLGCPQCYLPGWQSRVDGYAEPFLWQGFYLGLWPVITLLGCKFLSWYRGRWASHSRLKSFFWLFVVATVFDLVTEIFWLRTGLYSYPNGPAALWSDRHYRVVPIWLLFTGLWYAGVVCCRFYTNDKGETWAERGVSDLKISDKKKTVLRLLASVAMYNMSIVVLYMVPVGFMSAINEHPWPADIYNRSYLVQNICGPHTTFACMDPRVPSPVGPDSAHIAPDGKLIIPSGLPDQTRK